MNSSPWPNRLPRLENWPEIDIDHVTVGPDKPSVIHCEGLYTLAQTSHTGPSAQSATTRCTRSVQQWVTRLVADASLSRVAAPRFVRLMNRDAERHFRRLRKRCQSTFARSRRRRRGLRWRWRRTRTLRLSLEPVVRRYARRQVCNTLSRQIVRWRHTVSRSGGAFRTSRSAFSHSLGR